MKSDFFGYIPYRFTVEFNDGKISPVENFDEVTAWVDKYRNQDGFIYPPIEKRVVLSDSGNKEEVPNSERPALLHRIPASHMMSLSFYEDREKIRKGPGAFIIHLLAYLFGVRLQFYDWWFDGRVPIKSTHNIHISEKGIENFVSHCYQTWKTWPEDAKTLITNILYMHSRSPSYEWDWEQFMIEYMVFDGCWKLTEMIHKLQRPKHAKRFNILCEEFGILYNKTLIGNIVQLRNNLFHETLWSGGQPCSATDGPGWASPFYLRKFNQRLIPAILEYDTPYVRTPWWIMGTFSFK
jgi:hypothetical protein